jgi:adenosylcobinamide-phosphate synthase
MFVSYAFYLPTKWILAPLIMDVLLGDPAWLPHPIRLMGRLIAFGEGRLCTGAPGRDLIAGALLVVAVLLLSATSTWFMIVGLQTISPSLGVVAAVLVAWTTLAVRGLNDAAFAVERHLQSNDEESARLEIRSLVGRDTSVLDRAGLLRAAVESVAENSSDGVIAPLLFLFLAGPVGAVTYKAINTLDSMIGYKDAHHLYFGRCAARLDDFVNLVPARFTALCIAAAAALLKGSGGESLRMCVSDARKHESPNAGYPEAAMAGALGVELGGDAYYGGELEHWPRLGNGKTALNIAALHDSRILMWIATAIALSMATALRLFILGVGMMR